MNSVVEFERAFLKAMGLEGARVESLDLHIRAGKLPTADATLLVRDEELDELAEVAAYCVFEAFIGADTSDMEGEE